MHDLRALVVDDSKVGRLTMMKKLEAMGVTVALAESGQQALDYLAQHRPDMIFMDHMMPEMDGFETTRRIKASPATRDIPVIIISGNEDADFLREARAAGAVDAIAKPPAAGVLETLLAALPKISVEAAVVAAPTPRPAAVEPAPAAAMDKAALHALVERLVGVAAAALRDDFVTEIGKRLDAESAHQRKTLAEWGERLDRQAAVMAQLERGATDASTLESRLQALAQRLLPLEAEAGRPLPDFAALQADMDQRVAARLSQLQAQLQAQLKSELQARTEGLEAQLESLRQDFHAVRAGVADHAAQVAQRAGEWGSRLDMFDVELARVARDAQSMRSKQTELEQRVEQHIAQMRDTISSAGQAAVPVAETAGEVVGDMTSGALQAIQAELGEQRERLSEFRLRQLVADTLANLQPSMAAHSAVAEPGAPAGGEGMQAELARLMAKVKTLTVVTAVGGVLLLALIGMTVFGG